MKKIWIRTSLAVGLGLLGAAAVAGEAASAERASFPAPSPLLVPWTTVAVSGGVEARQPVDPVGEWRGVRRGDELPPRTDLRTGDRGRATLTRSGSLLIVDPKTELELPAGPADTLETSVLQNSGSVLYRVDGRKHKHFEVVTPYLVAGVKGTEFLVTVNERYTAVTVAHGLVEITDVVTGDVQEVGEGQAMLRSSDAEEVEFVDRGERGSSRLRKESRRLDQMERRDTEGSEPVRDEKQASGDDVAGSKQGAPVEGGKQPVEGMSADALMELDKGWDAAKGGLGESETHDNPGKEQVAEDLLEELVHEETKGGLLPGEDKKHDVADKGTGVAGSGSSGSSSSGSGSSGSGSSGSGSSGSGSSGSGSSGSGSSGSGSSGSGSSGSGSSGSGSSGSGSSGSGSSGSGSSGSGSSGSGSSGSGSSGSGSSGSGSSGSGSSGSGSSGSGSSGSGSSGSGSGGSNEP